MSKRHEALRVLVKWLVACDSSVIDRLNELFLYASNRSPSMFIGYQTHMELNRYDDFFCYDRNRVQLPEPGHQYIHANEIQLANGASYILTQAPLAHTVVDFWKMVLAYKVNTIAALSAPASPEEQYFSSDEKCIRVGKSYSISGNTDNDQTNEQWTTRNEDLTIKSPKQISASSVRAVWYKQWMTDRSVPPVANLLAFVRHLRTQADAMHVKTYGKTTAKLKKQPPIVIACPTGAIRAGLVAAIDSIVVAIENKSELDVRSVAKALRDSRYGAINTFDQYVYLYWAITAAARQRSTPRAETAHRRVTQLYERLQQAQTK